MKIVTPTLLACLVATSALAAPSAPPATPSERAVVRFDFELATTDAGKPTSLTLFTMTLDENHLGEAMLGDNVPLAGSGGATGAPMRQNVGVKLTARFESRGSDLLLDVDNEISSLSGPSVFHKTATHNVALAAPGKKTLVVAIEHDHVRTQLSVTPTRL